MYIYMCIEEFHCWGYDYFLSLVITYTTTYTDVFFYGCALSKLLYMYMKYIRNADP